MGFKSIIMLVLSNLLNIYLETVLLIFVIMAVYLLNLNLISDLTKRSLSNLQNN